jgi:hypothetical protein
MINSWIHREIDWVKNSFEEKITNTGQEHPNNSN